jgi:hypothetical protein
VPRLPRPPSRDMLSDFGDSEEEGGHELDASEEIMRLMREEAATRLQHEILLDCVRMVGEQLSH